MGWKISENLNDRDGLEKQESFTRRRHMKRKNCIHYIRHTVIAIPFKMTEVQVMGRVGAKFCSDFWHLMKRRKCPVWDQKKKTLMGTFFV